MHAINKIILSFTLIFLQTAYSKPIEKVFEGRVNLHVFKNIEVNVGYSIAPLCKVDLGKKRIIDLFILNERLKKMDLILSKGELVLFDANSNAVYYKGDEKKYEEVRELLAKRKPSISIYELDIKVKFNDVKNEIFNVYSGIINPVKEVISQNVNVDIACSEKICNVSLSGSIFLSSGNSKKINSSIMVKINNEKASIVKDDKSKCVYEVKVRLVGALEKDDFSFELPKEIFSNIKKNNK